MIFSLDAAAARAIIRRQGADAIDAPRYRRMTSLATTLQQSSLFSPYVMQEAYRDEFQLPAVPFAERRQFKMSRNAASDAITQHHAEI